MDGPKMSQDIKWTNECFIIIHNLWLDALWRGPQKNWDNTHRDIWYLKLSFGHRWRIKTDFGSEEWAHLSLQKAGSRLVVEPRHNFHETADNKIKLFRKIHDFSLSQGSFYPPLIRIEHFPRVSHSKLGGGFKYVHLHPENLRKIQFLDVLVVLMSWNHLKPPTFCKEFLYKHERTQPVYITPLESAGKKTYGILESLESPGWRFLGQFVFVGGLFWHLK